jgi:acetate kinase
MTIVGGTTYAVEEEPLVLALNAGSSTLKFAIYAGKDGRERRVARGDVDRIGIGGGTAVLTVGTVRHERPAACPDHAAALAVAFRLLEETGLHGLRIVGHRVVHGGRDHVAPASIDASLIESLRSLVPLAPLHLPAAIAGIEAAAARFPGLPQIACFDTAFHASLPELAWRLPLPEWVCALGVRKYGFHGLSYEYVMSTLPPPVPGRIVIAHLGNGASLVAVRDGRAIDTTMGLTPTGGVPMGTRTGDLDPGVMLYLARERRLSSDELEHLVTREAGLVAIGGTSDMKTLTKQSPHDPAAALAVEMFAYGVRKAIGSLTACLGGIDLLVFTGGIGEHAPAVRALACRGLDAFGIKLDPARNTAGEPVISDPDSPCSVRVVATDEDMVIARHAHAFLATSGSPSNAGA